MDVAARALMQETRPGSSAPGARGNNGRSGAALPITLGPEQAVGHPAWAAARDDLLVATLADPGVTLLLGAAGTGKSLLLQDLAQSRRATGSEVLYQARGDLPVEAPGQRALGRRRFVLIDEADRMDGAALDRLRDLGRCTLVLAGLVGPKRGHAPAFPDAAIVRLSPVPADAIGVFVAARLAQGGWPADLFTGEAVARLAALTGGVPRSLNILISSALFLAGNEAAGFIEAHHVDQAAALRAGDPDVAVAGLPEPSLAGGTAAAGHRLAPDHDRPSYLKPAYLTAVPLVPRVVRPRARRRVLPLAGAACGIAVAVVALAFGLDRGLWPDAAPAVTPAPTPRILAEVVPDRSPPGPSAENDAMAAPLPKATAVAPAPTPEPVAIEPEPPALPAPPAPEPVAPKLAGAVAEPPAAVAVPVPPSPEPTPPTPEPVTPAPAVEAPPSMPPKPSPAAAPRPAVALPLAAPARVTLRYAQGNPAGNERAASLGSSLRRAGFLVDGQAADLPRDAATGVRYFYAEDHAAAEAVLKAAGIAGTSTLWRGFGQTIPPRPGRVEVWMRPG